MTIKWAIECKVISKCTSDQQYPVTMVLSEEVLLIKSRFFEIQSKIDEINETEICFALCQQIARMVYRGSREHVQRNHELLGCIYFT